MTLLEQVARAIANHFVERFGARMHDGPSETVELFQPVRFNVQNLAQAAITAHNTGLVEERDTLLKRIEVLEGLVQAAYEEGVEDGMDNVRSPETLRPPEWIDSVARVEMLRSRAALDEGTKHGA